MWILSLGAEKPRIGLVLASCCVALSCSGELQPNGAANDGESLPGEVMLAPVTAPPDLPPPSALEDPTCDPSIPAGPASRLWMLTATQYANTIATLFNGRSLGANADLDPSVAGSSLPFTFKVDSARFSTLAQAYVITAFDVEDAVRASTSISDQLATRLEGQGCTDATCLGAEVDRVGQLLYRRPLDASEREHYVALAAETQVELGWHRAVQLSLQAILMAPQFLYRSELGSPLPTGQKRLTPFELASALSYSLSDGPPDQPLWDAALSGQLETPEQIAPHVQRYVSHASESTAVRQFFSEWLGYEGALDFNKDADFYDAPALVSETALFVENLLANNLSSGFLTQLLRNETSFVSEATQQSYGVMTSEATPVAQLLPGRFGIFGQPAWLSAYSMPERTDPIRRGRFIREHFLCSDVPDIPIAEVPPFSEDPNLTLREKMVLHTEQANCKTCHALMDPIGLGLEQLDHVGRFRDTEAGRPIDTSGELVGSGDQDGPFVGLDELSSRLAASKTTQRCLVMQSYEYFLGRELTGADACSLKQSNDAVAPAGDYVALLTSLFTSESFLLRTGDQP